jgi:NTP pyrophosphatase (non-canonical NTP hydrolase)
LSKTNLTSFQKECLRTWDTSRDSKEQMVEVIFGIIGEAGELVDELKKHMFHGHPLNPKTISLELGDLLYYTNMLASLINLSMYDVVEDNIHKRNVRYSDSFTTEASIERRDLCSQTD